MSTRHTRSTSVGLPPPPITYPGYGSRATIPAQGFVRSPDRLLRRSRNVAEISEESSDGLPSPSSSVEVIELGGATPSFEEDVSIRLVVAGVQTFIIRLAIQDTITRTLTSSADSSPSRSPLSMFTLPTETSSPLRQTRIESRTTSVNSPLSPRISLRQLSTFENIPLSEDSISEESHLPGNISVNVTVDCSLCQNFHPETNMTADTSHASVNVGPDSQARDAPCQVCQRSHHTQIACSSVESVSSHIISDQGSQSTLQPEEQHSPQNVENVQLYSHLSEDSGVDDDPNFSAGEPSPPEIVIRAPKSTETCARIYNQSIKEALSSYLDRTLNSYLMTLVIITLHSEDGRVITDHDVPCIVVLYNPDLDPDPDISYLPIELSGIEGGENFVCLIAEGEFEHLNKINSATRRRQYIKNPAVGASIGVSWSGTVGLFINTESGVMGLSCAHIIGNTGPDRIVTQPSLYDFKEAFKQLQNDVEMRERQLRTITHDITRYVRGKELDELKSKLDSMRKLKGKDDEETIQNLQFGTTTGKSEWDIINYGERRCIIDYEFFKVVEDRQPSPAGHDYVYPTTGVLGSVTWAFAENTGPLTWDLLVRKDGKTTGLTFGFIGGVAAEWKPGKLDDKDFGAQTCSEYWILEEERERHQCFADQGDSGASVIDNDGIIRGIAFARTRINTLRIIIDPRKKIPDIATIAERRDESGNVDVEDIMTAVFSRRCFILVQDIEMILERSRIGGDVIFNC